MTHQERVAQAKIEANDISTEDLEAAAEFYDDLKGVSHEDLLSSSVGFSAKGGGFWARGVQ